MSQPRCLRRNVIINWEAIVEAARLPRNPPSLKYTGQARFGEDRANVSCDFADFNHRARDGSIYLARRWIDRSAGDAKPTAECAFHLGGHSFTQKSGTKSS